MIRAYLFIYSNITGTREELKEFFDNSPSIITWRFDIENSFYLISEKSAQELYNEFTASRGTKGRFMFVEYNDNSQGQMLETTWYFLENKKAKPEEDKS